MPELPEVETMRRGIAASIGCRIEAATFPRHTRRPIAASPPPRRLANRLSGRTIAALHRFGKRIAIELAPRTDGDAEWLLIEPRMTGLLLVVDPPTAAHVRMDLVLGNPARVATAPSRLLFWDRRGLGTIRLVGRAGLAAQVGAGRLGPDGLVVAGKDLAAGLGRSRRAVKVALLDQRAVAGVGNIYAAEILYRAAVDPRTPCRRLPLEAWQTIARITRRVLAEAVRLEGSTIGDATYLTADRRPGRFQRRHRVYGRAGLPCRTCGTLVARIVQAQRATFFCPSCQWRPGRRSRTLATGIRG